MSADSHSACPQCTINITSEIQQLEAWLAENYGVVTAGRYKERTEELENLKDNLGAQSMREEHEFFGVETGTVIASYSATCWDCDFTVNFQHREHIEGVAGHPALEQNKRQSFSDQMLNELREKLR